MLDPVQPLEYETGLLSSIVMQTVFLCFDGKTRLLITLVKIFYWFDWGFGTRDELRRGKDRIIYLHT